jgi:hypothetical protein
MKSRMIILFVLSLFFNLQSFACTEDGKEGIAPENKAYIPVGLNFSGISETQFHEMIDRVSAVYAPIIQEMGATLEVSRNWTNGTVNAYASRSGSTWNVSMFGGLARHETVTPDGFALVMCHEVGHHLGGAPKYSGGNSWASNEGQSDYFGTLKCFRKVFENDDNQSITNAMTIPDSVKQSCSSSWGTNNSDYYLCLRSAMAGKSLANLLAKLGGASEPKFETPDSGVVTSTNHAHPRAQCRLDTYYSGSLCQVAHTDDVDQADEVIGTCHQSTVTQGVRPLCWFKPTI